MKTVITLFLVIVLLSSVSSVYAQTSDKKLDDLKKVNDDIKNKLNSWDKFYNKGSMSIHGTEYNNNQIGKPWLQLINSSGDYVNNGVCYIDIYTPDGAELVELAGMTNLNHDGIYYYDYALTDLPEGVYPVIARCYYEAIETFHYATLYSIRTGTFDPAQGTIVDTKIVDGVFIRFKEIATNPVRNISVSLNFTSANICNNITEDLLTGINIRTVTKFDSQVNDDITLSIWNHTSNSWVALPNKVLEGNAFRDVSNTFLLNNITKAGFVNRTGNDLRIKFQDTGLADTATSNLDIDYLVVSCNQLTNPSWQQVQGSSEMHITIPAGTEKFVEESLCGENSQNNFLSICSAFMNNVSISNTTWGYIYDKITFYNSYNTNIDEIESYTTSTRQDCSGVIDVVETRAGNSYSILDNVTLSQGGNENCLIGIPIIFNSTENDYYVEVYQENYMKWEVQRIRDLVNYYRLPIESFCNNVATQHGITYTLPLTASNDVSSLYATNPILLGCYRSMDDIWWFDDYYTNSIPINISGEYESYLFNIRFYYEELKDGSDAVSGITGNDVLVHVNTLCGESSQYPNQYSCAKLMPPDSYFTSQEGYLIQNLTVINDFNTTSSGTYSYSTAPNIDCSAVMEVIKDNGTRTDIYNQVLFNAGSEGSCDLNIPIRNVEGIPSYQIELYIENYILWDIYWARDNVNGWNDTVVEFCDDVVIDYNQEGQPSGGAGNIATELSGFSTDKILNYGTPDDLIYGDTGYCQWYTDIVGFPITINYTSSSTDTVSSYKMKATSSGTRMPKNWTVHGQLAGGGWELIDTQTNILWGAYEEKEFTIGTPASYDEYKITIISSEHLTRLQIDDIGFWASNSSNGTFKFIIPINSSIEEYRTNPELYFCYRAMDDLYWWYFFYNQLNTSNLTIVGELGSYRYESEYFWQRIFNDYNTVQTYNRNLNQIQILDEILDLRDTLANRVWNFMNRNLTDFNFTVNINNTIIAEAVWNYNGTVSQSLLSQLATYFWNYTGTINPILLSQITVATTNAIWNYSSTISSNILTQISNSVWNSPSRNLTSFDFNVSVKIGRKWTITDGYNNTDTGLIAYYHLDSNNGTINYTADSSGNSNNGQCINMGSDCNFTSGVWNNSMSFDGINDFINITQIRTTLQSANTFSVSVWFNNLIGVGQKGILTSSNGASDRFTLDMNGLSLRCGSYNGSWYSKSVTITSGYHHAVCIRNQSGVFLYYDNTVATGVTNPSSDTPLSAYIGAYPTPGSYWNGSIDEVMIYNRTLTQNEITSLYVNGRANWRDVLLNETSQTQTDLTDYQKIQSMVWNATDRNLTYYPTQVDMTNYTLIQQMVWENLNRSLTEFNFDVVNETEIANQVWASVSRTLTEFNFTVNATVEINKTAIADAVWSAVNRTLTDYNQSAQLDLTDYQKIQSMVWNATDRNLTYYEHIDMTNYTLIQEMVWNATTRSLTEFNFTVEVNQSAIAKAVWEAVNRTLSDYNQTDLTNYDKIQTMVWNNTVRTLTDFNFTVTASVNNTEIANEVWASTNRTLTDYNQTDLTDYKKIQDMVWNATMRSLTEFNFTVSVDLTAVANAVWNASTRELTNYNQSDLTDYNKIQTVVWNNTVRTLTSLDNITINATVDSTAIAGAVWNYTNKTVDFATTGSTSNVSLVENIKDIGQVYLGGTEYIDGDAGKVVIRLVRGTGALAVIETGATCVVSLTYPDQTYFATNASMTELGEGVYYYDFTVPARLGVYTYYSTCNISDRHYFGLETFHVYPVNQTAPSIWNYPTRNLTYYEVANLTNISVIVDNAAVAQAVWNYSGTVNPSLLNQFTNSIECLFDKYYENSWGVNLNC